MNKRDFLYQGSGMLLAGAAWAGKGAAPQADAAASGGATATSHAHSDGTSALSAWQALLGEHFEASTALGRPVRLVLQDVSAAASTLALTQFTLAFEGPKGLPLVSGLHTLHHEPTGQMAVHLEPVRQGERMRYLAHFSLLA